MNARVELEFDPGEAPLPVGTPDEARLRGWIEAALGDHPGGTVSIRLVDEAESAALNQQWRQRSGATNVLSFPAAPLPGIDPAPLGDLALCSSVIAREAVEQGKTAEAHWAHMVVHGVLHLIGYDHQDATEADTMESHERAILARLGHPDPYPDEPATPT